MYMPNLNVKHRRKPKTLGLCSCVRSFSCPKMHVPVILKNSLLLRKYLSDHLDETFAAYLQVHNTFSIEMNVKVLSQ